jgi:hypothetical protein
MMVLHAQEADYLLPEQLRVREFAWFPREKGKPVGSIIDAIVLLVAALEG